MISLHARPVTAKDSIQQHTGSVSIVDLMTSTAFHAESGGFCIVCASILSMGACVTRDMLTGFSRGQCSVDGKHAVQAAST